MSLLVMIVIGAVAGWLAGLIVKGYGFGILGNIAVGIVGAIIGGWLFGSYAGTTPSLGGQLLSATAGAVILLLIIRVFRRA